MDDLEKYNVFELNNKIDKAQKEIEEDKKGFSDLKIGSIVVFAVLCYFMYLSINDKALLLGWGFSLCYVFYAYVVWFKQANQRIFENEQLIEKWKKQIESADS